MDENKENQNTSQEDTKNNTTGSQLLDDLKSYSDTIISLAKEIINSLISISLISASLLIIATFNPELIPLSISVKILVSILLILIPLGIWVVYVNNNKAIKLFLKMIQETINKANIDISESIKKIKKPTFLGIMPIFIYTIFTLVVVIMIFLIWKIDLIELLINLF